MNTLQDAETWLYHLGDVSPSRADRISDTNADLIITEWASYANGEAPYTSDRLDRMRGERFNDDKKIVSYLSIGEAENYRYYWKNKWADNPPNWIDDANPEWIDNINVKYWNADWQDIIFGYVDRIVEAGFDGVYLDLVSAYEYWEDKRPNSDRNFRAEMADFVAAIKARAEDKRDDLGMDGDFYIIGQNALELVNNAKYRNTVDGIAKEDLRFYYEYGSPEDFEVIENSEYQYHLNLLKKAEDAGIATFVVEYIPEAERAGADDILRDTALDLGANGTPIYVGGNRDLDEITTQPVGTMNGVNEQLLEQAFFRYFGTAGDDVMLGTDGFNELAGLTGDDVMRGKGDTDNLRGGGGDDRIFGGRGGDSIHGGEGDDILFGMAGFDELKGRNGDDVLFGGDAGDRLIGGRDDDLLRGSTGNDGLSGGTGHDELYAGKGRDVLHGGRGDDIMTGGGGADIFSFQKMSGNDVITDFNVDRDEISLGRRTPKSINKVDGGVLIDHGNGNTILLEGLNRSDISEIDFLGY